MPRLPLKGSLDLTYRCNNTCRHCWLWLPPDAPEQQDELTFDEIRDVVDQARALGCREWAISGGEPSLIALPKLTSGRSRCKVGVGRNAKP
jgi:MoaA/NifB/PqqE/SkfB family radical SAM enzyme